MATGRCFLCFLLLLVTQESRGRTYCRNPTERYRNKGTIVNRECMTEDIEENQVCLLTCKRGGAMILQCNMYGVWEELQDYCQKECLKVDVKNANETIRTSDGEIGKTVEFICHEDFVLKGHQKITCQQDYTWDHPEPVCESRRYTHEVIKAMEALFFPKIKYSNNRGVDVILLLDVSSNTFVRKTVDLMKSLLLHCEECDRRILYTLITYGNEGYEKCYACDRTKTIQELDDVATKPHGIGSNLGSGLSRIFTNLLMMDRISVARDRILLVVTGQNPSISYNHQLWTKMLREDAGFRIFVLALGDLVNKDEFRLMADQPWQDHFFYLKYSQIHEAVGNLTNNESLIVNSTSQLVHQIKKGHLKAENVPRLILYVEAPNRTETFDLMKQVAQNMMQCIHQPELTIALNVDNGTVFESVDTAVKSLEVELDYECRVYSHFRKILDYCCANLLQAEKLLDFDTLYIHLLKNNICKNLQIIMFLSYSGPSFKIDSINDLKDLGCEMYAVGVGEQPRMEKMQELVSFPWYLHLARASEATVECDG